MAKTNAIRILEVSSISYDTVNYKVDENDLSGVTVADKIGVNPEIVFKTLVAKGDKNGINIFCIPVAAELNLKKAASASDNKKIEMIRVKDLFPITGYIRGGCSPIGMKRNFPTYIEETVQLFDKIYVSAGIRGTQIFLIAKELQRITNAVLADLI